MTINNTNCAQPAVSRPYTVNNQPNPETGKFSVAAPTSLSTFFMMLLMHACKKVILIDPYVLSAFYAVMVTVLSVLSDIIPVPQSYFANRNNLFNVYFVKLGWAWTLVMLGSLISFTSYIYCCANKTMVKLHLSRLAVGTVWWWCCTTLFDYIHHITGFCDPVDAVDKFECRSQKGTWIGFDISGHTFILVYSLLMISEEVKVVKDWAKIADVIKTEENGDAPKLSSIELFTLKETFEKYTPYVRFLIFLSTLLVVIWNIMLLSTVLYFHNMPQKLLGMTFALVGWFTTYCGWYLSEASPGIPGKGRIKYN